MNMKRYFILFAAMLSINSMLSAQTPDGLSCETAIPVDTSYVGSVPAAGTYYYSASTYDLPMTCYFYPEAPISELPTIYVDFTCTPGYYEDPNLANMIQSASGWGIEMPIPFYFNRSLDEFGREVYTLSIDESYREMMTMFNITYDVDAIVQVTVPCGGDVQMVPDTTFRSCVENSKWLNLPDTVVTGLQHEGDSYVLPFADWRNDSIRFRWTGSEAPVTVWIGEQCDFEMNTTGENCALDMFVLYPDAGNGENIRKFSKQEILDYISLFGEGGVYYMRTACAEDGELIVEKQPMSEIMANAKALTLNQPTAVAANDAEQLYYFPASWKDNNMLWTSSSDYPITAYFSANAEFEANESDANIIDVYSFAPAANGRELALSKKQMKAICDKVSGDHVFVKLVAAQKTNVTPALWSVGPCAENADELFVNDSVRLQRNATSTAWRVNINQWAQQDVKLYWKGTSSIKVFLCDTCKGFTLTKTNAHVKLYKEVAINSDGTRDTLLLTKDELAAVAEFADSDGYMYFRFNNSATGSLIVKANVVEPEPKPEPAKVIALKLDSMIDVPMEDMQQTYCFTRDWENISVEFTTNTVDSVIAYMGTKADFELFEPETGYIAQYPFFKQNDQSRLQLSAKQLSTLLNSSIADTIFVSFYAFDDVQITPILWNACACVENSFELMPNDQKVLAANSENTIYRVNYNQWQAHDVRLHWAGSLTLWAYLGYTCDFNLSATNKYVLNGNDVDILPNDTMVIGEEVRMKAIDWGRLPADGFLYFRFHGQSDGVLTSSIINRGNGGPTTGIDNVSSDVQRHQLFCTPEGVIYILVDGERYTLLGEKL